MGAGSSQSWQKAALGAAATCLFGMLSWWVATVQAELVAQGKQLARVAPEAVAGQLDRIQAELVAQGKQLAAAAPETMTVRLDRIIAALQQLRDKVEVLDRDVDQKFETVRRDIAAVKDTVNEHRAQWLEWRGVHERLHAEQQNRKGG